MAPKVSIIIPIRDHEEYLDEALQSVRAQDFQDYEIIVVDSTANGIDSALRESYGSRTLCLRQIPPQGVSAARNFGLRQAQGKFAVFLDSDDRWDANFLGTQVGAIEKFPDAVLCFSSYRKFGEGASPDDHCSCMCMRKPFRDWVEKNKTAAAGLSYGRLFSTLLLGNVVPTSSVILRRKSALEIGTFDESLRVAEDYDYWLRLSARKPVAFVDQILMSYRMRSTGLSGPKESRVFRFVPFQITIYRKLLQTAEAIGLDEMDRGQIRRQLAHYQYVFGTEIYKKTRNRRNAFREILQALTMMKAVGLTFVEEGDTWWKKIYLVVKPYLGLAVSAFGVFLTLPAPQGESKEASLR